MNNYQINFARKSLEERNVKGSAQILWCFDRWRSASNNYKVFMSVCYLWDKQNRIVRIT